MTSIVKELRENGGWAVITRTVEEDTTNRIFRAIIMSPKGTSIVPDANNIEEIIFECECRLRDLKIA